ncbi:MAG: ATP-binding protein [Cyanosarcina radialis HA8281-LM2]|jgi:hypothetical protein|nr:ATP-binding protein [Cyanosarcina radialis HA8281-LM2]
MSILDDIYNQFDPSPLPAGSKLYVDCREVRGGSDILVELGSKIQRSHKPTCQLYTGHRGCGKSTELLRLANDLEQKGCQVVYFAAEDGDINPEDVEYTDILLACTRHLLESLKTANSKPVLSWLQDRWQSLKEILQTEIMLDNASAELQIQQFAKIATNIRTQPSQRAKLRQLLNPHTENLVTALNQFIADAKQKLPPGKSKLVVIADGLDKIPLTMRDGGRTNHDEVFIDRSEQLKALDCHVIYTVPISLVLSSRATDLTEIYNCNQQILPAIMVQTPDDRPHEIGIQKLKEILRSRVYVLDAVRGLKMETEIFDHPDTLRQLCLISGGHVRNLILLVQTAIDYNEDDKLPIQAASLQRAVSKLRNTYRITANDDQWALLAKVHRTKRILNDDRHRSLLFNRCLLEYQQDETWHDVHPVLRDVPEFKEALAQLSP